LQASGFPLECDTDEKKGQYIADYAAKEGIQLDPRQIVKNPGLFGVGAMADCPLTVLVFPREIQETSVC
jgi:hypothetical protein